MFKRIAAWWNEWDDEMLALLQQPNLASAVRPGWRRNMACKVGTLTPIERQELYRFCTTYRGWAMVRLVAKLCLAFTVLGVLYKFGAKPDMPLWRVMVAANALGFTTCMGLVMIWFNHTKYVRLGKITLAKQIGMAALGGLFGGALVVMLRGGGSWSDLADRLPSTMIGVVFGMLMLLIPGTALAMIRSRHHELLTAQLTQEAEQARLARELSETQLRLLRAQIEPHFLFNTLGAVQQLAQKGAPKAAELTAHLIDFLRASTSDMRCEQVSLDTELGLVASYLGVMQIRLGERLRFSIDLPPSLADTHVPSMLVLTLAENAIKHGIEPSLRGGEIAVAVREEDGSVRIGVRDSGVGMSDTPGNGTGLENLRHRLRLAYGDAAFLLLSEAEPGLMAEIVIPAKEAQ